MLNILLQSESLRIESSDPPALVLERLRGVTSDWRESRLTPAARSAGLIEWKLREHDGTLVIRARISGRNGFLPRFVGTVEASAPGSFIIGELRFNWFTRVFTTVWFCAVASAPLFALFEPIPGVAWFSERILMAAFMLVPAAVLFTVGVLLVIYGSNSPISAFRELLTNVANPLDSSHGDSSMRGASDERGTSRLV
jgi:hypothetical protein